MEARITTACSISAGEGIEEDGPKFSEGGGKFDADGCSELIKDDGVYMNDGEELNDSPLQSISCFPDGVPPFVEPEPDNVYINPLPGKLFGFVKHLLPHGMESLPSIKCSPPPVNSSQSKPTPVDCTGPKVVNGFIY